VRLGVLARTPNCLDRVAAAAFLRVCWKDVKGVASRVDMLLGFDNRGVFPMEVDCKDSLTPNLYRCGSTLKSAAGVKEHISIYRHAM
jgi:hypothetical protein